MSLPDPVDQLDDSFYQVLSGGEPMGAPLPVEQLMALDQPIETEGEAALVAYDARREAAADLLEKGRDLRAYVRFVEAHAILEGPKGLHAGLHLLDAVVRAHWDAIHPAPPGDPAAINARRRAFAPLREPKLASWFDRLVLFDAGGFERAVTIRHAWLLPESQPATRGRRPAREGETVYDAASFTALVARAEAAEAVSSVHAALTASAAILKGMQAFFAAMPDYDSLRFAALAAELEVYAAILAPFATITAAAAETADATAEGDASTAAASPTSAPAGPALGVPTSRADALALFDAVIAFYAETSRSSPVALALVKLRSLEAASFAEWLRELEPESPDDVRLWLGNVELAEAPEAPATGGPDLDALTAAVAVLAAHEGAMAVAPEEIAAVQAALAALQPAATPAPPVIRDRAAVRQALQRLATYYRHAEPSNPASLCFERLIDLVDRSFLDILKRVAPKGLNSAALRLAG